MAYKDIRIGLLLLLLIRQVHFWHSGSDDKTIKLWNIETKTEIANL